MLDCGKFNNKNPDWVICQYRKGIKGMLKYYNVQEEHIDFNYFSVDFSELFVYMYNTKKTRIDFKLIDYIFAEKPNTFDYTLLFPALVELKNHYTYLRKKNKKLKFFFEKNNANIMDLLDEVEKFDKNSSIEATELVQKYNSEINFLKKFYNVSGNTSYLKYNTPLGEGFNKLTRLFEKGILLSPSKIDSLNEIDINRINRNDCISLIKTHDQIYNSILNELRARRHSLGEWNDKVDAEHAALAYVMNKVLPKNELLNIFTGSSIPMTIYENKNYLPIIKKDNIEFSIPKCPIYATIRLFCERELSDEPDKIAILKSSDEILKSVMTRNIKQTQKVLYSDITKNNNLQKIHQMAIQMVHFNDIFLTNEKLVKYLDDALKINKAHDIIPSVQSSLSKNNVDDLMKITEISKNKEIFDSQDDFDNVIEASDKYLYKCSEWIYTKLCKKLGQYDTTLLPPSMKEMFALLKLEPLTTDEFESELQGAVS